ncbi:MAG: CRISPR-associated exonuclease Cas4/endonuclease Cas1 fusion [Pirellulaceae bacterium]|nr:MAG: CRISPR-associated exonuclease Cas4/endonuclease Cas1 fusion [Pirellulaceae bacterium]
MIQDNSPHTSRQAPTDPSLEFSPPPEFAEIDPPIRVMALHALLYCERLFYLEEVEEIRVADDRVYAGRRLHDDVAGLDDETSERRSIEVATQRWGIFGKVDALRRRDGCWIAYEHKRGRCRRGPNKEVLPWPSDRIQAIAYAVLLSEHLRQPVPQARIRYHADNATAIINIDAQCLNDLCAAISRAVELRNSIERPPVTENEFLCPRCSLAPVCLPEEERLASRAKDAATTETSPAPRLPARSVTINPPDRQKQTLHITDHQARIGRSGHCLTVTTKDDKLKIPTADIDAIVIHGFAQISTQAIHLCTARDIGISWVTAGGRFLAGTSPASRVQQRLRQYEALRDPAICLRLSKHLMLAKIDAQLKFIMRSTRGNQQARDAVQQQIDRIREAIRHVEKATALNTLLGLEGTAAKAYFASLPSLITEQVDARFVPDGRNRRPPRDPFNCLLGFGYALLQSAVFQAIVSVGLEPAFGFYHQPRSAAHPLVLDIMELFRTTLWDMPLIASINRRTWDIAEDFDITPDHVWLTLAGKRKAIEIIERRLQESYKHPHTGKSITYERMIELEVRLLEKEWSGAPGLFGQFRIR